MDYLARREHGEQELQRKLTNKGFDADVVNEALKRLVAEGLQSDSRFTESFVHSRFQRGSGPQKIRAELRERGIEDSLIADCIEAYDTQWRQLVRQVREKKFGAALPADFKQRSRQMRFLQQRGFTPDQITGVFRDND